MLKTLRLPRNGRSADELLAELEQRKSGDADWRRGRTWSLVYYAGDEHAEFLKRAYGIYFSENAVSPSAYPSLAKLEAEVLAILLALLNAQDDEVGIMTSGGTESILLAMKAYRDQARNRGLQGEPEILLPISAHPSFLKAADYFGLRVIPVELRDDYRASPEDAKRKLSPRTVCIVASAPSYPQGVVDPVPELAQIAREAGVGLHVDACLGAFVLPFMRTLERKVPEFDFRVPGVTSISADLHKNAYAAKGTSAILYRTADLRGYQFFVTKWRNGVYGSPSMQGTRAGGNVATAWAALMHLGEEGYTSLVERALAVADALMAGIREIPGLYIVGEPDMTVFSFGARDLDIFGVARRMSERGWRIDKQVAPDSIHMIATPNHEQSVMPFLSDLKQAVDEERSNPLKLETAKEGTLYGATGDLPVGADPVEYVRSEMGKNYDLA